MFNFPLSFMLIKAESAILSFPIKSFRTEPICFDNPDFETLNNYKWKNDVILAKGLPLGDVFYKNELKTTTTKNDVILLWFILEMQRYAIQVCWT